jgi:molybdopterin-binding protein
MAHHRGNEHGCALASTAPGSGGAQIRSSERDNDMKISARNQLPGIVRTVTQGQVMAEVVDVEGGHELVSAITADSARRLGLVPGKRVAAIIKSTEVMLAVDD